MTPRILALALSAALSGALPAISYAAPVTASFEGLGFLPNGTSSDATGVSGDGSVAVGYATNSAGLAQAFSWSSGAMTSLGSLNPTVPVFIQAFGTNSNGSVVVGTSAYPFNGAPAFTVQAFRYSGGTMTGLGFLSGLSGVESIANGVSGNGSVVVGWSNSSNGAVTPGDRIEAFRWSGGTMSGLGYLPGGGRSIATGISSNGSVVVGFGPSSTSAAEAFRWTASTGMIGLGSLPSGGLSQATATNANGSVVVGNTDQGEAFIWTAKKGMVGLTGLNQANAVSAQGSIVVGQSATLNATVWTRQTGADSIQQLLLADGINSLAGWVLLDATGISADGTIIVGDGIDPQGNNEAWIADIPRYWS